MQNRFVHKTFQQAQDCAIGFSQSVVNIPPSFPISCTFSHALLISTLALSGMFRTKIYCEKTWHIATDHSWLISCATSADRQILEKPRMFFSDWSWSLCACVAHASSTSVTRKPRSAASRTADSTHWFVTIPVTTSCFTPAHHKNTS